MTATKPRESLYLIEESLQLLDEERAAAEAEGDSEAIAVIDKQISEYISKEAAKVDSYAGLMLRLSDEQEAIQNRIDALKDRKRRSEAFLDRLKQNSLEMMQRFGVKELKTATTSIRRQGNGGVEELDVFDRPLVPRCYLTVSLKMNAEVFMSILSSLSEMSLTSGAQAATLHAAATFEPDNAAIREALKQRVTCPECKGVGAPWNNSGSIVCARCQGVGTIPATIPGAKLLERGEHIRVT